MTAIIWVVGLLVLFGAVLAMAGSSATRMTRVPALALKADGPPNAALLERVAAEPARHLNGVYLCVMFTQNGSAILVAIISQYYFGSLGITLISVGFTIVYFLVVEAMAKTFGILHSDRVALALAPLVFFLGRMLSIPTRALIALPTLLLPPNRP